MFCKDCKDWERNTELHDNPKYGNCYSEFFVDSNDMEHNGKFLELPDRGCVAFDYEGHAAGIQVSEYFGCIHFKIKEK